MPSPSGQIETLRPELGEAFEEFNLEADRRGFVGHRVLPFFGVQKKFGPFGRITIESLLQNRETERSNRSGYSRGDFKFEDDSFNCKEHGAEEPVDDNEVEMYANYFDVEMVSAQRAYDVVLRNAEKRAAAKIFDPTVWTGADLTTAVSNEWDDATNATPVDDVNAAVLKVWESCGLWPNALVINRLVFRNLRNCDQIIDRSKSQGFMDVRAGAITEKELATVFDLEHVIVAGSPKNLANEGQSVSIAPIWSSEYAMVCRVATSDDIREPCVGRTFRWKGGNEPYTPDAIIESYREPQTRADIIRARHDVDEKLLYKEAGHLLSNITTSA